MYRISAVPARGLSRASSSFDPPEMRAAHYYDSMQPPMEDEFQHIIAMAVADALAAQEAQRMRPRARGMQQAPPQRSSEEDFLRMMDVNNRARKMVDSHNPNVLRKHGEEVEARCLQIGRVLVEYLMQEYLAQLVKAEQQQQQLAAAAAGRATIASKAAVLESEAQALHWQAHSVYKQWKGVVPKSLYELLKQTLLNAEFSESVALRVLHYYLEDHPSEQDVCIIFVCVLRLPKKRTDRWRQKLLQDALPVLLEADVAKASMLLTGRILLAQKAQASDQSLNQNLLSPPADSSDEEEDAVAPGKQASSRGAASAAK